MSQSGAVGAALLDRLDVSSFVSVGNKADVSGNDLLEYWEDDDDTGVIALYLESFGNPRRFARIARRVGKRKPVLLVKSGRGEAGGRAVRSHTAARRRLRGPRPDRSGTAAWVAGGTCRRRAGQPGRPDRRRRRGRDRRRRRSARRFARRRMAPTPRRTRSGSSTG
ncbi:hypothetical protein [Nonomuraea sp. NPDC005650]|uniref:hypothetical protein n=1 Tax=Nonomuraea sp. NPDC005650 TaxID=3157045 RepID=UPI0033A6D590